MHKYIVLLSLAFLIVLPLQSNAEEKEFIPSLGTPVWEEIESPAPTKAQLINAQLEIFTEALDKKDYDIAVTAMKEAIKIAPKEEYLHWNLFTTLYRKGDIPAAREAFNDYLAVRYEKTRQLMANDEMRAWMKRLGLI